MYEISKSRHIFAKLILAFVSLGNIGIFIIHGWPDVNIFALAAQGVFGWCLYRGMGWARALFAAGVSLAFVIFIALIFTDSTQYSSAVKWITVIGAAFNFYLLTLCKKVGLYFKETSRPKEGKL